MAVSPAAIKCQPSDISSRPGEARDEPSRHRVTERNHNDRDHASCLLRGFSGWGGGYDDYVCLETQAVGSEGRKPLALAIRGQVVDIDGPPIYVTQITQVFEEWAKSVRLRRTWVKRKEAEPRSFPRLLRQGRERRGERTGQRGQQEAAAVHHSMTSSARASSDGGIVRPRALAVLRLMISSYLDACSMGSSAGLAPLRILSM